MYMSVTKRLLYTCHTVCVVKGAYVCNTEKEIALVYSPTQENIIEANTSVIFNAYILYI